MIIKSWALANESNRDIFVGEWLRSLPPGSSLLDAGAGSQRYRKKASHLQYVSQDFGDYEGGEHFGQVHIDKWNSKKCDIISNIIAIPVDDGTFDFVLCTEVFEHLPSPELALNELTRILKPGGKLLITAPFRCLYHQDPYFFYSGFSKYWYQHYCEKAGLNIELLTNNGNYYNDLAQEIARTSSFGNRFLRLATRIISAPILVHLFLMDRILQVRSPESCWGYHLLASKPSK